VQSQIGFSNDRLVCSTGDGLVLCLDSTGRLFAATRVQSSAGGAAVGVHSLCIDSSGLVYGGCEDKCVRVWCMEKGFLKEVSESRVHESEVTAVAISGDGNILVTGGDDGSVSVLKIE
jgi:WD40 repeat protein